MVANSFEIQHKGYENHKKKFVTVNMQRTNIVIYVYIFVRYRSRRFKAITGNPSYVNDLRSR